MSAIGEARFTAEARLEGGTMAVRMEGNADTNAKPHFQSFFQQVHQASAEARVGETVVDLRKLAFMSSSCFKDLLTWVMGVGAAPPEAHRYRIRFVYDSRRGWQKRGLRALTVMAPDVVTLEDSRESAP